MISSVGQIYASLLGTRASTTTDPKSTSSDTTLRNGHISYKRMGGSHSDQIHLTDVSAATCYKDFNKSNDVMYGKGITVRHDVEVV